ncbi:MAG: SMP-30/gluconolactonase/LRE family protein [Desulfovibrionaceae bacterium]|nr:SMP-30/gluconolactonase/LRE family protein [Desulfovibrionaceae bacterium]
MQFFSAGLVLGAAFLLASAGPVIPASAADGGPVPGLAYPEGPVNPVPIPPSERGLMTVTATPWLRVTSENHVLEGAIFDREGRLLFCDVTARKVLRAGADKKLETLVTVPDFAPGGLALHPDGRLFIAALDFTKSLGIICAVQPDGSGLQTILGPERGFMPNDLVFDSKGGFYFTDFQGTATQPDGGVYYVSPDGGSVTPVLPNLAMANGLALSPDGKTLWVTEFGRGLLHRTDLADATTIAAIGSIVPYRFTGTAPDSMRMDADGNVYVAVYGQGRIMAFNRSGLPTGQILLPGREKGENLVSTSLAIRPGSRELYAVTATEGKPAGSMIFSSAAFAAGLPPAGQR